MEILRMRGKAIKLTDEQRAFLKENYEKFQDLNKLTQKCFDNKELKGSSREGRAVRAFLVENGLKFKTTKFERAEPITFTQQQKEFIFRQANDGASSYEIAQLIFPDRKVIKLGLEQRAVLAYIQGVNPDFVPSKETAALTSYIPPKATARLVKKINDAVGLNLEESKLSRQYNICVDKLRINLANSRFVKIMNNFLSQDDRNLFEEEFVRLTWDKPDLTADEINLYMNVCKEVINLELITKHMHKLNELFEDSDGQEDMTMRLAEIIKAKSAEYHQCEQRIENLTKKLQGDRAERMKSKNRGSMTFLSVVQLFQEEEERKNMLKIVEMQKQLIEEEAHRLESMDMWKARVLGVSIDEVV